MAVLGLVSRLTFPLVFPGQDMPFYTVELDPMASHRSNGWQVKIAKQSGVEVRTVVSGYYLAILNSSLTQLRIHASCLPISTR